MKKQDYISWDEYFMGVAMFSSMRSKDPSTQVGACIVNQNKRIVGIGYNGFPIGCSDDVYPWAREGAYLETKYPYVVHAESNAILNATNNLSNATIYVTLFPCNECMKLIIQSGISEIVYLDDKYNGTPSDTASKKMADSAGVKYRKMNAFSIKVERK